MSNELTFTSFYKPVKLIKTWYKLDKNYAYYPVIKVYAERLNKKATIPYFQIEFDYLRYDGFWLKHTKYNKKDISFVFDIYEDFVENKVAVTRMRDGKVITKDTPAIEFKPQFTSDTHKCKASYSIKGKTCTVKVKLTKKNFIQRILGLLKI